jgi:hypothetical protein
MLSHNLHHFTSLPQKGTCDYLLHTLCFSSSKRSLVLYTITVSYSSFSSNDLLPMLYKTPYIHYVLISPLKVSQNDLLCHLCSTIPIIWSHLMNKCCRVKEERNVLYTRNRRKLTALVTSKTRYWRNDRNYGKTRKKR